jgi:hypothetical protein
MRKSLVACLAVVLVLAGGLVAVLGPRHCPVNRAAFERIEKGMTQAEVRAILGGPPGEYHTRPSPKSLDLTPWINDETDDWPCEWWLGDRGYVRVVFEPSGAVHQASFVEEVGEPVGLVELARWRLGWLGEWLP